MADSVGSAQFSLLCLILTWFVAGVKHQDAPASNGFALRYQQKCSSWRNSREMMVKQSLCCWAFTAFKSMQQRFARRCGVTTKDEKDIRGRWKGEGNVSGVDDDVE